MKKHHMRPELRQLVMSGIIPIVLLAFVAPLLLWACLPLALWLCVCLLFGAGLAVRTRDPAILLAGPAAILMHTAWSLGFWHALMTSSGGKYEYTLVAR
jgi:succinoglycan biosynthesis protein ExoA